MSKRATAHPEPPTIHLVTSGGGHIDLLRAVSDAFDGYRVVWVTGPSLYVERMIAEEQTVHVLPEYDRHPIRGHFVANALQALRLVAREKPKVVVTPGAGVTVPFCLFARLAGARIVFTETMARVTGPSASGKVLSRLATTTLVQWPEVASVYPRTQLCRPVLLEMASRREAPEPGEGTFVAVGTHSQPFDRLLAMVDDAVEAGVLPGPIHSQGAVSSYRPRNYELRDWIAPRAVEEQIAASKYIICHAGTGLVTRSLSAGRRPMVLPREVRYREHFDNHQRQIAEKLGALGLVVPLGDRITETDLQAAGKPLGDGLRWTGYEGMPSVELMLRQQLGSLLNGAAP